MLAGSCGISQHAGVRVRGLFHWQVSHAMFSQTVDYALRAVVSLASQAPAALTSAQIATMTRVPAAYLSKVLRQLVRGQVVHSQRGMRGGFVLSRSADEISILEVINAVDPITRITSCPLGLPNHGTNLCPLHRQLDQSLAEMQESFSKVRVSSLMAQPGFNVPLCGLEGPRPASGPGPLYELG